MTIRYHKGPGGSRTALNITAPTQVATVQGSAYQCFVNSAPTAAGGIYDAASSADAVAANLICAIPTTGGVIPLAATQFFNGLYVDPGTGGVVAIGYDTSAFTSEI